MADGILGLGSGQSSTLSSDLITKLKTAESTATVKPIETKITNLTTEKDFLTSVETKVKELLTAVKPFDLFVAGGVNALQQKSATTSGDSVTFDAADVSALNKGFTTVSVSQLAQKDVYQSKIINKSDVLNLTSASPLVIGTTSYPPSGTTYKSYDELISAINTQSGVDASLEQVGTSSYRLVLKSESTGKDNALTITDGTANLGFNNAKDSITGKPNHVLTAQNMNATVDGIAYDVSTNNITVNGLKITANKLDTDSSGNIISSSTINVSEDTTNVETQMNSFVTKYNELVSLVGNEINNADSKVENKSALKDILNQVKDKLFGSYGVSNNKSIFNYGFELDKSGTLSLNSTTFKSAIQNDMSGLRDLFIGTADKKGLGTTLKETIDNMRYSGGVLNTYDADIISRQTKLTDSKTKAEDALTAKYSQLASQFAAYTTLMTQMESSFSGLKMMISQSTSSNN